MKARKKGAHQLSYGRRGKGLRTRTPSRKGIKGGTQKRTSAGQCRKGLPKPQNPCPQPITRWETTEVGGGRGIRTGKSVVSLRGTPVGDTKKLLGASTRKRASETKKDWALQEKGGVIGKWG